MVSRITDGEEVHKLVMRTFQELWFAPAQTVAPPGEEQPDAQLPAAELAARAKQLVAVVSKSGGANGRAALRELLEKVMTPPAEATKDKSHKEHEATLDVCAQLVGQLVEDLLTLDESGALNAESPAEERATAREALSNSLLALSLFCQARPQLLLPHMELLPAYLQHDGHAPAVFHVCDILASLLEIADHPPKALLERLETLLGALIFRVPEGLLRGAIAALCATVAKSHNHQLLHEALARLFQMMTRARDPAQVDISRPLSHKPTVSQAHGCVNAHLVAFVTTCARDTFQMSRC